MIRRIACFVAVAALVASCVSIRPRVVSRKTEVEEQIVGGFEKLQRDLVLASSVRGAAAKGGELSPAHREALMAVMNRQFRRDDIEELKQRRIAGEALAGTLEFFATPDTKSDQALNKRARQLVTAENADREIIMQRVIDLHASLDESDLPAVRKMMAEINQAESRPGTLIQDPELGWIDRPDPRLEAEAQAAKEQEDAE